MFGPKLWGDCIMQVGRSKLHGLGFHNLDQKLDNNIEHLDLDHELDFKMDPNFGSCVDDKKITKVQKFIIIFMKSQN